jgi:hypothetical protein
MLQLSLYGKIWHWEKAFYLELVWKEELNSKVETWIINWHFARNWRFAVSKWLLAAFVWPGSGFIALVYIFYSGILLSELLYPNTKVE